jgi:hypothetical protein
MTEAARLEQVVSSWSGVLNHAHRFGGREFRYGRAEIGHVHTGGIVDIPFPRAIRDALLEGGLAQEHHWVPDSGWITYRIRSEENLEHALWLMRISYLRYALKMAERPEELLDKEAEALHLSSRFKSLLKPFARRVANQASSQAIAV